MKDNGCSYITDGHEEPCSSSSGNSLEVPSKVKQPPTNRPSLPLLGVYPGKMKTHAHIKKLFANVYSGFIHYHQKIGNIPNVFQLGKR